MSAKSIIFGWKIIFFLGFSIVLFAILCFRLFDLQILKGDFFLNKAEDNRLFSFRIAANRGVIFDRYFQPLSWNERVYYYRENIESLYSDEKLLFQDEAMVVLATDEARVNLDFARYYLPSESLSHTLGYVAEADKESLANDSSLALGQLIGHLGLEKIFEKTLRGVEGSQTVEINALAQQRRNLWLKKPQSGNNIETTLDPILSQFAWDALGDQKGVIIINDAKTGELLALVSKPGFDPNFISQSKSLDEAAQQERQEKITNWLNDSKQRFFHRAIAGVYPPGSIFKLVTSLAGLENGALNAGTTVVDEGVLKVGDYEYRSWLGRAEGEMDLVKAIARSNDIFFYKAAEWIGPDNIAVMAKRFGFGSKSGIELLGEQKGLVPSPAWKENTIGERWFLGNTYHFGIGQGDLLVTPLQISQLVQALANNASICSPHLIKSTESFCHEVGIKEENLELVLRGMLAACSSGGTASIFFPHNDTRLQEGVNAFSQINNGAIACKTGTAEFGGQDEQGKRNTHAWWVGIIDLKKFKIYKSENLENSEKTISDVQRERWSKLIEKHGFPERITITVMAESDEENPFKEGSIDAAKPAKEIIDWILGE
ncbi:MAG: penicillin-binding transpeptidase domain-containing protein [Patescibacteria group bacterium]